MKRPSSLPVLVQVAALAALAVVMSQAVAFGVVVLAPEPKPAGFSIEAAANALKGEPAETSDGRALRRFGSQGQQRAALLALLFAEREALAAAGRPMPMLLLDDVMSELDPGRRERLVARLQGPGQALITAADEESLPPGARAAAVRLGEAARGVRA